MTRVYLWNEFCPNLFPKPNQLLELLNKSRQEGLGLKETRVTRFEFETHGNGNKVPPGTHSLHFPFYQMNTSQFCPINAECTGYSRTKQKPVQDCPMYCQEFCSLYPKHLNTIGRGNSIFGFNKEVLTDPEKLHSYLEPGIDRLVFSM